MLAALQPDFDLSELPTNYQHNPLLKSNIGSTVAMHSAISGNITTLPLHWYHDPLL